jgi:GT2 family glycosyltransferase
MSRPSATIIVLNYNGVEHLKTCLPTVEGQDYPSTEIMVVDNGSRDGSAEYVRTHHPRVRVLELGANKGFAPAYNEAARAVSTEWMAFLNNDTRIAPTWLSELVAAAERNDAASAAAAIVDWDGSRVDFVGGLPTFIGHAWQIDYGQPVGTAYPERRILFGCGGAVLFRRSIYLEAGGFDDSYFIYFEDVDIGWRLAVMGHPTVFAPKAITYHRLHGTTKAWAPVLRLRLYERNALATVFKNYGDEGLGRVLPAAVALMLGRNLAQARLDGSQISFDRPAPQWVNVPPQLVATLIALEDFARALPDLREKRRFIQSRRRVADEEVLRLMPEPLKLHDVGDRYRDAAEALIRDFRIAELFGLPAPARAPAPARTPVHGVRCGAGAGVGAVSVIVLTASGGRHLPECLSSLRAHEWPADRTEVIVVDNGSSEDPTAAALRHYPGVRVIRTGRNLGFSAGNNAGAKAATGDYLAFLNDDTRVAPSWLTEMMAVAQRRGAASVAARILDWDGARVDFAGGLVNFEGRGYSLGFDQPAGDWPVAEAPLLFGCGAAVLFRRDVFEATGGWDEPTFAYYEDVEFGWRLWLLGHEVWFAPKAVVFHKHHGTSSAFSAARARAFERNALRMIYTHLEEETLRRALPAALLLSMDRALLGTSFSRADEGVQPPDPGVALADRLRPHVLKIRLLHALSRRGAARRNGTLANLRRVGVGGLAGSLVDLSRDVVRGWEQPGARQQYMVERVRPSAALEGQVERLPAAVAAAVLGINDFFEMLPETSARRAWLQSMRKRSDAEIVGRFGAHWLSAVPSPRFDAHVSLRRELMGVLQGWTDEAPLGTLATPAAAGRQ